MLSKTPTKLLKSPPPNASKNGDEHELQYTRWLLSALGVWIMVSSKSTKAEKALSFLAVSVIIFAIIYTLIPFILFLAIRMRTMNERFGFFGTLCFQITSVLKWFLMMQRTDALKKSMEHIQEDWLEAVVPEEHSAVLESVNFSRRLTRLSTLFLYSGGIFFQAMRIFEIKQVKIVDDLNITIREHILPRYDYLGNTQKTPFFEIANITYFVYCIFLYISCIAVCNLIAVFIGHVCGQVQVIKLRLKRLEKFTWRKQSEDIGNPVACIIHCHVKIIGFVAIIRKVLREICFLEFFYSITIMCWLEFFFLRELANNDTLAVITYATFFVSVTFNIFILCYGGEILKNECVSVAQLAYAIDWYQIPPKNQSSLIMIIAMARYPQSLSAGGILEITIQCFGQVLKTSVAYFQMLRTVTG